MMKAKKFFLYYASIILIATMIIVIINTGSKESVQREDQCYKDIMTHLNSEQTAYDDRTLIFIVQKYFIQPPSSLPYHLSFPENRNPSPGQTKFIDEHTNFMRDGLFAESGAFDGEHLSNTLFLERYRNWTGILIEPNPDVYKSLVTKNRKAFMLNACLSTKKYPSVEALYIGRKAVLGKVVDEPYKTIDSNEKYVQVQCFPLYTILLALDMLELDYFSLDVEGAERGVLDTVPWDKVNIKTISIEHNKWVGGKQNLTDYMETKGYKYLTEVKVRFAPDLIFEKR